MLDQVLIDNVWLALILWAIIYSSDYYLTLATARLHAKYASDVIVFEGGIELTPQFRADIASLRTVSPRFLAMLAILLAAVFLVWLLAVQELLLPEVFLFFMGGLILMEAAIHSRHFRNLALFRCIRDAHQPSGRIVYPRWLSLRLSSVELAAFGAVYLLCFLLAGGYSVLGGAVFCGAVAFRHWLWSRKARAAGQAG